MSSSGEYGVIDGIRIEGDAHHNGDGGHQAERSGKRKPALSKKPARRNRKDGKSTQQKVHLWLIVLLPNDDLSLFEALFNFDALRRDDANDHVYAALHIPILDHGEAAALEHAQSLRRQPQHIVLAL